MCAEANEVTGKETTRELHKGIVVQHFGASVRVYNNAPLDKGGDVMPETSEIFSLNGRRQWCEVISEKTTAFPIPASLM